MTQRIITWRFFQSKAEGGIDSQKIARRVADF
jgi:hypothetical protein